MTISDAKIPDIDSIQTDAANAVNSANGLIEFCANAIRQLSSEVRSIAIETIDVLLSSPSEVDIELRKTKVVEQYSSLLLEFSKTMDAKVTLLNWSWMDVDQSMGLYLVSIGRSDDVDPQVIRQIIDTLSDSRKGIPDTTETISNLTAAIKSSAGGLPGLEKPIAMAVDTLDRLNGELDLGDAVIKRQIILGGRLSRFILVVFFTQVHRAPRCKP